MAAPDGYDEVFRVRDGEDSAFSLFLADLRQMTFILRRSTARDGVDERPLLHVEAAQEMAHAHRAAWWWM